MARDFFDSEEPWNMNVAYLKRLDDKLNQRDDFSIQGILFSWYRALRVVYRNIHWKIKEESGAEQQAKEKSLEDKFRKAKLIFLSPTQRREQINQSIEAEMLLDEIDMELNDLMIEYDLVKLEKTKHDPKQDVREGKFTD